ncbi:phosphate uptake regulator PhoU [Halarchaeum nitratireducens]|nr:MULTISPECIES: phosphate uptake regulator PhoU [Halarchaeum]MBP2250996.1 phosphate uptake regulator [Halarchaeum solikamskense]
METRKVQLSGGTTYTVSLPKTWAEEHGIEAGSVLRMHTGDDGSLLVEASGNAGQSERAVELTVSNDDDTIRRQLPAAYSVGVDAVTLIDQSRNPSERRPVVEDSVRGLSGFEVLETTESRIRLTNLIDAENVDVRKSTLRLRLVVLAMHRDALTAVCKGDEALARQVIHRDDEADKLFSMITRHFRRSLTNLREVRKLGYSRDELFEYYYAARQFERIGDHAEKIATLSLEPDLSLSAAYIDRLSTVGDAVRDVVDDTATLLLESTDLDEILAVTHDADRVLDDVDAFDRELYDTDNPGEAYMLGLLLDSLRRTVEYGGNIADIALQQRIRTAVE